MEAYEIYKSLKNSIAAKKCLDALINENPNDYLLRVMKGRYLVEILEVPAAI